ncbi:MAG: SPOR domain-containing protein [Myxococcaceae bacterium]
MRDAHRMKEKLDLSLDGRQVGSVLIGGVIVLGAVFVLGVVVGKQLATNEQTQSAPDILTALDQKAQTTLTFQEELTRKQPVLAPEPEPVKPVAVAAPAPKKVEAPEPAAKVAEAALPTPSGKVDEAPVTTRTSEEGLKEAFARVSEKRPAEAAANGAWTLQISASQKQDEAERFAARLRDRGYAPFIVKAEVAGKGTWYRVRMGSFPSKDAANRYLNDFKRETQISAFVASND